MSRVIIKTPKRRDGFNQRRRIRGAFMAVMPNCWYCGCPLSKHGKNRPTLDHVIPTAKGGAESIKNMALACESCNGIKRDKYLCEVGMKFFVSYRVKNLRSKAKALIRDRYKPTHP